MYIVHGTVVSYCTYVILFNISYCPWYMVLLFHTVPMRYFSIMLQLRGTVVSYCTIYKYTLYTVYVNLELPNYTVL